MVLYNLVRTVCVVYANRKKQNDAGFFVRMLLQVFKNVTYLFFNLFIYLFLVYILTYCLTNICLTLTMKRNLCQNQEKMMRRMKM